jgi:C1A family cysteine protease
MSSPVQPQATVPPGAVAGLLPDPPDPRDLDMLQAPGLAPVAGARDTPVVASALRRGAARPVHVEPVVKAVSLREHCGKVRDQGELNSCTAHAAVAPMELAELNLNNRTVVGSPMFTYKATRNFLLWKGDSGAFLRTAPGSLALFGVLPEDYWPYDKQLLDDEPSPFCYQLAQRFRATSYFRVDSANLTPQAVVDRLRGLLRHGVPAILGYTVYFGAEFQARDDGGIPLPLSSDLKYGGHALMVCGYDDEHTVVNTSTSGATSHDAFLIQNSRGSEWGEGGFGWLPYDYFLQGMVSDVWSVVKTGWINLKAFGEVTASQLQVKPATAASAHGTH